MELYISITAALISIVSFGFSVWIYYAGLRRQRKQATLDAFNILQGQVLDKLNTYTKTGVREIAKNPRAEEYKELSALLARCEHFAVGVNTKIYDVKIVRRLAEKYFVGLYDKMEPLIQKKREINKTAKHYDEFEKLVKSVNRYQNKQREVSSNGI